MRACALVGWCFTPPAERLRASPVVCACLACVLLGGLYEALCIRTEHPISEPPPRIAAKLSEETTIPQHRSQQLAAALAVEEVGSLDARATGRGCPTSLVKPAPIPYLSALFCALCVSLCADRARIVLHAAHAGVRSSRVQRRL